MFRPTRAVFAAAAAHAKYTANVARGVNRLSSAILASGKGSYVETTEGKRLLDFTSGIGVTCLGHAHPKVSEAAAKQCMTLVHGQCSIAHHAPGLELIDRLLPLMPDASLDTFFFSSTGAEAVENAMKLARAATGKQNIIVMRGGYHGRSVGTMALTTSKTVYSAGFFPLMPGVYPTTFPYWHQMGLPVDTPPAELAQKALFDLSLILSQQSSGKDTAAIIIEPVLGEGGYVPVSPEYMRGLREVCDKHGILLICDEVQSGFLRTGKYFATEYSGVRPDIMVMAKGIANGFPLSAIASRRELMDKQSPGSVGGTYAGNAVACAAAVAVADAFKEERILENVQARSRQLFDSLNTLRSNPYVLDVRGAGLMVATEFASPTPPAGDIFVNAQAPKSMASRVSARCLEKGMLLLTTSVFETVRFIPPLNISEQEMAEVRESTVEASTVDSPFAMILGLVVIANGYSAGCSIFKEAVEEVVKEG